MRSLLNRYSLIFFIYLSLIPFLFSEERLFLKQADLLESKSEGNKNVKYISGNIIPHLLKRFKTPALDSLQVIKINQVIINNISITCNEPRGRRGGYI